MEILILNDTYIEAISNDEMLIAKIAQATGRKISSVKRWINSNDELLTTATVLNVIKEHLGLKGNVVLTKIIETA